MTHWAIKAYTWTSKLVCTDSEDYYSCDVPCLKGKVNAVGNQSCPDIQFNHTIASVLEKEMNTE